MELPKKNFVPVHITRNCQTIEILFEKNLVEGTMKTTTKLQELFHRDKIFVSAIGACALHARIAEEAGFECAHMSGMGFASMVLGLPDAGFITMTEVVENAQRMANTVSIPLISDADQGFGNAINGILALNRWSQAPSFFGIGKSLGNLDKFIMIYLLFL